MSQFTKEYFDQKVDDLNQRLKQLATADALAKVDSSLEHLAVITRNGFDATDEKLKEIAERLDVRTELDQLKSELQDMKGKLEKALHVKL